MGLHRISCLTHLGDDYAAALAGCLQVQWLMILPPPEAFSILVSLEVFHLGLPLL